MKEQKEIEDATATHSALYLKKYCANHDCATCIFYGQMYSVNKECKLGYKNLYGEVAPPERWEVF